MIRNLFLIVYIFFPFFILSQEAYDFKIPKGNNVIVKEDYNVYIDIHLSRKGNIYLNKNKIKLENLAEKLIEFKSGVQIPEFTSVYPILYIENGTNYRLVETLKEEISRAWIFFIIYKTQNVNNFTGFQRKLHMSSNYIQKKVILKNDGNYEINLNTSSFNDLDWLGRFEFNLYSKKFNKIKNQLSGKNYQRIEFLNKNYFKIDKKKVRFNNYNFTKAIEKNEIIFIEYGKKLKYQDYLFIIASLNEKRGTYLGLQNKFKVKDKKYISFIEISRNLGKILKKKKVNL